MLIKILPDQVVQLWETIKYAATAVDEIDEKDLSKYLNELLHSLLNEKAQCFVRLDDKREIIALFITKFLMNTTNGEKYFQIQCVYGFKAAPNEVWKRDWEILKEFAKKENCSYMGFVSRNKRIWDIGKLMGMDEAYRTFKYRL